MIDGRDWGEVFRLIEETLVSHAVEDGSGSADPDLEFRRASVRSDLSAVSSLALDPNLKDHDFWAVAALKPFYAGTQAVAVESCHQYMMTYLYDWQALTGPEWRPSNRPGAGGDRFEAFLADANCYQNRPRLTRTIEAALGLSQIKKHFPDRAFMQHFIQIGGTGDTLLSKQKLYANFRNHLRLSEVAAYHLMMELGFPVLKPDRVVNRVALRLGLISWTLPNGRVLGPRAAARDTDVLGSNEKFAWELQTAVQSVAASTGLPVRKLDYLLVKLGQEVSATRGAYRRSICARELPQCGICLASPLCRYPKQSTQRAA